MSVEISITIPNLDEAKARFNKMPAKVASELNTAIKKGALLISGNAKKELGGTNGGWDTGRMANSITPTFGVLRAEIAPHVTYAVYVHQGTRPHWAPISELAPWARRHGMNPYAVQASIARKGTKANPFMERAAKASEKDVQKIFLDAVDNIVNTV